MADVSRVTGPLGPFAAGFVDDLWRQGFRPVTVGKHVALLAGLSSWLAAEGVAASGLSTEVAERFCAARRAAGHRTRVTIKALDPLLGYLRGLGVAPSASGPARVGPVEELLSRFRRYLEQHRFLATPVAFTIAFARAAALSPTQPTVALRQLQRRADRPRLRAQPTCPPPRHTNDVLDEETRKLLQEVAEMAATIGDEGPVERFYHEHEVGTLFDRCRGMFAATLVLLDNGFVQEAAVFCRPLFVDSLALAEIAAADEKRRISLVLGRQLAAIAGIEGIFREMQARGDEDVTKNLEHVVERRCKVEKYARRHDASTKQWDPEDHVKALADKHGRGNEYTSYRLTHHFVHGSAAITEHRSSVDDEDVARIGGPHLDVEIWERPTALFAAYSLALACRAACSNFGYDEPQALEDLQSRIESMHGETDGAA